MKGDSPMAGAACAKPDVDSEWFFDRDLWAKAAVVCSTCPLATKAACLKLTAYDEWGYSGGMTPRQRTRWRESADARPDDDGHGPAAAGGKCRCGAELPLVMGGGRRRLYCSRRCMQHAYDERRKKGIVNVNKRPPMTDDQEAEVVRLWHAGYSLKQTAEAVDLHRSTVQRVFAERGLTRTHEQRQTMAAAAVAGRKNTNWSDARRIIGKLLEEGYKPKEAAELSGYSIKTVYTITREQKATP